MKNILDVVGYFNFKRFKQLADYPKSYYKKDDIITAYNDEEEKDFLKYTDLFKELKWYEERTLDELIQIKFIEVLKPNYYIKGDKIKVTSYIWNYLETPEPTIIGFNCNGKKFMLDECLPANECNIK